MYSTFDYDQVNWPSVFRNQFGIDIIPSVVPATNPKKVEKKKRKNSVKTPNSHRNKRSVFLPSLDNVPSNSQ